MTCGGRRRSEGSDNDSGLEHGPKESGCGAEKGKKREAASQRERGGGGRLGKSSDIRLALGQGLGFYNIHDPFLLLRRGGPNVSQTCTCSYRKRKLGEQEYLTHANKRYKHTRPRASDSQGCPSTFTYIPGMSCV